MRTAEQRANLDFLCGLVGRVDQRGARTSFDALTDAEKTLWLVWDLEAEVNNGGFKQYFFNISGDHAGEIVEALKRIGADGCAAITAKAIVVFGPEGPPRDRDARVGLLEGLSEEEGEQLDAVDDEFYAYPDPLESLLAEYTKANATQFL